MWKPGGVTIGLVLVVVLSAVDLAQPHVRTIGRAALVDKIRGGWAGQMIGVSYGAPTEFTSNGQIIDDNRKDYKTWGPGRIREAITQDDLYVEMTFAEVLEQHGLDATTQQFADMFKGSRYRLWHANAAARRWLNNGVDAPMSGHPSHNIHANDIDFQIESDFIGLMTPGLPQEANRFCDRVGRVMNYGDGLYGGMFVTGMYSAAFFEQDPRQIVEAGVASIPAGSQYARVIRDVLAWHAQYPDDWRRTWQLIEDNWDKDDPCPDGALLPFNIDAKLNGAYIALGLLYGSGDLAKTLDVSTRAGQDSDCNPSSAAGVLGVVLGYEGIPAEWKQGFDQIADQKFEFTDESFNTIVESTAKRALAIITRAGGRVTESEVTIPFQAPKPPKLEQWEMGVPTRILDARDAGWIWQGDWLEQKDERGEFAGRAATAAGARAEMTFEGSAVALVGPLSQDGGQADVFLDGRHAGEINAYIVERTWDNDLWHAYGLKAGTHTLRVVVRDSADPRSTGRKISIIKAISFRPAARSSDVDRRRSPDTRQPTFDIRHPAAQ